MNKLKIRFNKQVFFSWLLITFLLFAQSSFAQQSEDTKRGIAFYNQGKDAEAIESLKSATKKNKEDIEAWHYLGLALARDGKTKDAMKAFEKAIEKVLDEIKKQYEKKDKDKNQSFLSFLVERNKDISLVVETTRKRIEIDSTLTPKNVERWKRLEDYFVPFIEIGNENKDNRTRKLYSQNEVTTKAKILEKPNPKISKDSIYSPGSREFLIILEVDGTVGKIVRVGQALPLPPRTDILREFSDTWTNLCIVAAKQIKFTPAEKNGEKVAQIAFIEYLPQRLP